MSLTMSNSLNNNNNSIIINNTINNSSMSTINSSSRASSVRSSSKPQSVLKRNPKYTNVATMLAQAAQRSSSDVTKALDGDLPRALERIRDKYLANDGEALLYLRECQISAQTSAQLDQLLIRVQNRELSIAAFRQGMVNIVETHVRSDAKVIRLAAATQYHDRPEATRTLPQRLQWNDQRNTTQIYLVETIKHHAPKIHSAIPAEQQQLGYHTARITFRRSLKRKQVASDDTSRPTKRRRMDTAPAPADQDIFGLGLFEAPTASTFAEPQVEEQPEEPVPMEVDEEPAPMEIEEQPAAPIAEEQPAVEQPVPAAPKRVRFAEAPLVVEFEMTPAELQHVHRRLRAQDTHEEFVMKLRAKEVQVHRKRSPMGYCLTRAEEREIEQSEQLPQEEQAVEEPATTIEPMHDEVPEPQVAQAEEQPVEPMHEEVPVDDQVPATVEIPQVAQAAVVPPPQVEEQTEESKEVPEEPKEVPATEQVTPEAVAIPVATQPVPVPVVENTPTPLRRSPRLAALKQPAQRPKPKPSTKRPKPPTTQRRRRSPRLAAKAQVCYKC